MSLDTSTLNENQRKAVLWNDGPLLVLASPGSGKTRVLTTRIARIVQEQSDASVLALTFTNKAATEMRERVEQLLGHRADSVRLSTFHSYATQILRQHGGHVGVNPDFTMITLEEDRLAYLKPILRQAADAGSEIHADQQSVLRLLDYLFREAYDGGARVPGLTNPPPWIPIVFTQYCAALCANNRQDFGSLLHFVCRLLREKPSVARVVRVGWSHVCVDEFQDTNSVQYEMLKLLAPPRRPNLFVVGDDDQIIYQWNGANPERLASLRREYDIELIQLPENFRCPGKIVEFASNLIEHNKLRAPNKEPLVAHRAPSMSEGIVRYEEFDSPEKEAEFVAKDIKSRAIDISQCVVLARTTKLLVGVARALQEVGLTPYLAKSKSEFESAPIQVFLAALRLANSRHDREALRRLCVAWEALTRELVEVEAVIASATFVGGDFLRAWFDMAAPNMAAPNMDEPSRNLFAKLRSGLLDRLDFPGIVDWYLAEDWHFWRETVGDSFGEEVEIWKELHEGYRREYSTSNTTLHGYLQFFDLTAKVRPRPRDAVRCLTVHGAKGLEFKHVYLVGLSQDVLPSFQALRKGPDSRELEEERRNFFVAITRAQETLTLTRSTQYNGWPKEPSQFLFEMAGEQLIEEYRKRAEGRPHPGQP